MARTSNITFAQVAQIADTMKAAGTRPTARAVRERIGSGSMGTIHKLLQQWAGKAAPDDEDGEGPELPSSIASALMDFVSTQVAEACEPLNEELNAARAAADALAEDNERVHSAFDIQAIELSRAYEERAACNAQLELTRSILADHESEVFKLRAQVSELLRDLDKTRTENERLAGLPEAIEKLKSTLKAVENGREDAQRESAVLHAQLEAKTEQADELRERLKEATIRATAAESAERTANTHYQACAARLEAAAREIETLKAKAPRPTPKTKTTTAKESK